MVTRLVLGCGGVGARVVRRLADGPARVVVVDGDENRVDGLRDEGIDARTGDVTDDALHTALSVAAEVVAEASLVGYLGSDPTADGRAALRSVAGHVIDPGRELGNLLQDRLDEDGGRIRRLRSVLGDIDGRLAIVTHDNPDPDAVASGAALGRIAAAVGVDADVCYYGNISHQENRAFVNLLEFDLRNLADDEDITDEYAGFALVDHSRPGVNDGLPPDLDVDVVIDHHPPRGAVDGRFLDLRHDVGATSTLFVDYFRHMGIETDRQVATGLLFGIWVDTDAFRREVSATDFDAASFLLPHADTGTLARIESPSVSTETADIVAHAIAGRDRQGQVVTSCVGDLTDRDALAQAADRLLTMEGVTTTLVYGVMDDMVYLSARSRGANLDLGEAVRDAFGQIGSAGGHADMAGAQIGIGDFLADVVPEEETDAPGDRYAGLRDVIADRFYDALGVRVPPVTAARYGRPGEE